jgi:hypothetical protein
MADEGTGQDASAGEVVGNSEVGADSSAMSADEVEGEQPEGERAADDGSIDGSGLQLEQREADGDDGDDLAEPVRIDARTRANRRNANRSTGPKTDEGKRRSSLNALKHGVYARSVAIPSGVLAEDQDAVDKYLDDIVESLDPQTVVQCRLAENIANLMLRAARVPRYEAAVIGETPDPLMSVRSSGEHEYPEASRRALGCIDQVTKIDSRIGTSLQQAFRQYEQVLKMGFDI